METKSSTTYQQTAEHVDTMAANIENQHIDRSTHNHWSNDLLERYIQHYPYHKIEDARLNSNQKNLDRIKKEIVESWVNERVIYFFGPSNVETGLWIDKLIYETIKCQKVDCQVFSLHLNISSRRETKTDGHGDIDNHLNEYLTINDLVAGGLLQDEKKNPLKNLILLVEINEADVNTLGFLDSITNLSMHATSLQQEYRKHNIFLLCVNKQDLRVADVSSRSGFFPFQQFSVYEQQETKLPFEIIEFSKRSHTHKAVLFVASHFPQLLPAIFELFVETIVDFEKKEDATNEAPTVSLEQAMQEANIVRKQREVSSSVIAFENSEHARQVEIKLSSQLHATLLSYHEVLCSIDFHVMYHLGGGYDRSLVNFILQRMLDSPERNWWFWLRGHFIRCYRLQDSASKFTWIENFNADYSRLWYYRTVGYLLSEMLANKVLTRHALRFLQNLAASKKKTVINLLSHIRRFKISNGLEFGSFQENRILRELIRKCSYAEKGEAQLIDAAYLHIRKGITTVGFMAVWSELQEWTRSSKLDRLIANKLFSEFLIGDILSIPFDAFGKQKDFCTLLSEIEITPDGTLLKNEATSFLKRVTSHLVSGALTWQMEKSNFPKAGISLLTLRQNFTGMENIPKESFSAEANGCAVLEAWHGILFNHKNQPGLAHEVFSEIIIPAVMERKSEALLDRIMNEWTKRYELYEFLHRQSNPNYQPFYEARQTQLGALIRMVQQFRHTSINKKS